MVAGHQRRLHMGVVAAAAEVAAALASTLTFQSYATAQEQKGATMLWAPRVTLLAATQWRHTSCLRWYAC